MDDVPASRPLALSAVVAALGLVALVGCSSDDGTAADGPAGRSSTHATSSGAAPGTPRASSTSTGAPATSASTSGDATVPECTTADLSAAYRGSQGAAGHVIGRIVLTDTSASPCSVTGFGGLSYVGGSSGRQVGAAADRDDTAAARTVVLQPGGSATSEVSEAEAGDYDADECRPTAVKGFRVYPPDQTASLYVSHPTTGCAARGVHLLTHQPYR